MQVKRIVWLILFTTLLSLKLVQLAFATEKTYNNKYHKHYPVMQQQSVPNHHTAISRSTRYIRYGIASYYGEKDGFDGRRMANGRKFNKNNINLAAHPTLPLGTKLKVTDMYNGRSIYVEITDRMSKRTRRIIDLSVAGARRLGMQRKGIARVKLEKVSESQYSMNKKRF